MSIFYQKELLTLIISYVDKDEARTICDSLMPNMLFVISYGEIICNAFKNMKVFTPTIASIVIDIAVRERIRYALSIEIPYPPREEKQLIWLRKIQDYQQTLQDFSDEYKVEMREMYPYLNDTFPLLIKEEDEESILLQMEDARQGKEEDNTIIVSQEEALYEALYEHPYDCYLKKEFLLFMLEKEKEQDDEFLSVKEEDVLHNKASKLAKVGKGKENIHPLHWRRWGKRSSKRDRKLKYQVCRKDHDKEKYTASKTLVPIYKDNENCFPFFWENNDFHPVSGMIGAELEQVFVDYDSDDFGGSYCGYQSDDYNYYDHRYGNDDNDNRRRRCDSYSSYDDNDY